MRRTTFFPRRRAATRKSKSSRLSRRKCNWELGGLLGRFWWEEPIHLCMVRPGNSSCDCFGVCQRCLRCRSSLSRLGVWHTPMLVWLFFAVFARAFKIWLSDASQKWWWWRDKNYAIMLKICCMVCNDDVNDGQIIGRKKLFCHQISFNRGESTLVIDIFL